MKIKNDLYKGKHWSFHFTLMCYGWEFHLLPFIDFDSWRILCGWLCFTIQYIYKSEDEEWEEL